jgi:PhzF family phenazine biosynthesis protein
VNLPLYQVDAFSDELFGGNPAALVPLEQWLPDQLMQKIAAENNLAETAFFVPTKKGYHLRWFTPTVEIPLCGHATLACAFLLYEKLGYRDDCVTFETLSGDLIVRRKDDGFIMDFPTRSAHPVPTPTGLDQIIDARVKAVLTCEKSIFSLVLTDSEKDVRKAQPDFNTLMTIAPGNFILTAPSEKYDFVSRVFVPEHGIPEDPVTGSAHCVSAPYWAEKLGKTDLTARQISARGGDIRCHLRGDRVDLFGKAVLYLEGRINV